MPPKRTSVVASAAAAAPRAAAVAAAPMTVDAVEQLIEERVYVALANHETLRNSINGHGDGKIKVDEDDDPDVIIDIFKIEGDLFEYGIRTYEEYELNNTMTMDLEEPWLDNRVPYQLCDHICEPYHFKNGITKWHTCSSDIDGFCNRGELPGMVRVENMTYFQDLKWYEELADGKLKDETLMHKAKVEESWGNSTPGMMKCLHKA
ncbi:hypothetical protein Tco_0697370 [Tanacetum coccineum]